MILLKRSQQELEQVSFVSYAPKRKNNIICPVCENVKCYEHCNNCGKSIYFKKDETGKWICMLQGTELVHKGCMKYGTASGKYLDVNGTRSNNAHWWRDYVVHDKDNKIMQEAKIHRYQKLTGYGYTESLKEEKNLWLVEEWRKHTFDPGKKDS